MHSALDPNDVLDDETHPDRLAWLNGREVTDRNATDINFRLRPSINAALMEFCRDNMCSPEMAYQCLLQGCINDVLGRRLDRLGYLQIVHDDVRCVRRSYAPPPEPEPEREGFLGWISGLVHARA